MSMPSSSDEVATRHGSRPALSSSSMTQTLLARQGAVVRARDLERWYAALGVLAAGEIVEPQRDALGRAPVVDKHQRRAMLFAPA